jgi:predicted enzyme related to lactoylglutathione lyase
MKTTSLAHDLYAIPSNEAYESAALRLPVRNLVRSINFFSTVLGLQVNRTGRLDDGRYVAMSARGGREVIIHDTREPAHAQTDPGTRRLFVADLDAVRARAWDFGSRITRRAVGADRIHGAGQRRSLWIADPDGHELELAEGEDPSSSWASRS